MAHTKTEVNYLPFPIQERNYETHAQNREPDYADQRSGSVFVTEVLVVPPLIVVVVVIIVVQGAMVVRQARESVMSRVHHAYLVDGGREDRNPSQ